MDTSAQFNVMPPQVARALRLEVWPTRLRFKGVDCVPKSMKGYAYVNVSVHGVGVLTEFLTIDD